MQVPEKDLPQQMRPVLAGRLDRFATVVDSCAEECAMQRHFLSSLALARVLVACGTPKKAWIPRPS
jgi:hypothetical protein